MKSKFAFLIALAFSSFLFSQNRSINYKALVKDGGGNVVANQSITVQFAILQGVGMTTVYQETHVPTTDANGLIIVNIGSGTPDSGDYNEINWGNDDHLLNVHIDTGNGLIDMGTTEFMAVPYAIQAQNVNSEVIKINDLVDGKSDNDGSNDGSSVFLGINAGLNDDGSDNQNVGIGLSALREGVTGHGNVAIGWETLVKNEGQNNVAIGTWALRDNIGGQNNTAIGYSSLSRNNGFGNSAIGVGALDFNETGFNNTANGSLSLRNNISGNRNTAIGTNAGYNSVGGGNVFIGHNAGYNETNSNKLYIENTDADANNALIYGDFFNNVLRTNSQFQIGNPIGTGYSFPAADGTSDQILKTDGSGSLVWANDLDTGAHSINDLIDGKTGPNGLSLFIGTDSGFNDLGEGTTNVGVGFMTLFTNILGTGNTAIGIQTLYSNTSGSGNTAIGGAAMLSNTSGDNNIAIGGTALRDNISGRFNSAIGNRTLYSNTSGDYNTAIGYSALYYNIGSNNTANGVYSLYSNLEGTRNVANGYRSLYSNTDGNENTAMGADALYNNILGQNNTAMGSNALLNNNGGSNNTSNGSNSLFNNTSGNKNTANGYSALYFNTTGYHNTANGFESLRENDTGYQNTANGYQSLVSNTDGYENTANGSYALNSNSTGIRNTATGFQALSLSTTGSNNTAIGYYAQVPSATGSNQVRIGNSSIGYAGVQVAWDVTSDKRWKDNIRELPYGLDVLKQLKPVDYVRKNNEHKTREMGFIAQDVEALLTKIGYTDQGLLHKDDKGYMSLRYNDLIALLTKAIQEQQVIIDEQNKRLTGQELKIETQNKNYIDLLKRVEQLENIDNQ